MDNFPSAPPRFRTEPLSTDFIRLVDVIFAVTLTQTLVVYREEIVRLRPVLLMVTLGVVYVTVALSWVGYHRSISKYPYNKSSWSRVRLSLDVFILVVYAFLAFAAHEPPKVILGLSVVFLLYAIDGASRIAEWKDWKVSKPWLSAIFSVLILGTWWFLRSGFLTPLEAVLASGAIVVLFRPIRQWLGYPRLIIIGVDVDGVLAEQIPALLERLRLRKNIATSISKASVAEWAFRFDGTDIATEMEEALLDPQFVTGMLPVTGSVSAMESLYRS